MSTIFHRSKQGNPKKAFSLIELLLVIILLGIIAGLAIPNFSRSFASLKLKETTNHIFYLMRFAQSRAILGKKSYKINFDKNRKTYQLYEASSQDLEDSQEAFTKVSGRMGRAFSIPLGIVLSVQEDFVMFYPNGKMDRVTIILNNEKKSYYTITTRKQTGYIQLYPYKVE